MPVLHLIGMTNWVIEYHSASAHLSNIYAPGLYAIRLNLYITPLEIFSTTSKLNKNALWHKPRSVFELRSGIRF